MKTEFCLGKARNQFENLLDYEKIHYPNRNFAFSQFICIIWDEILSQRDDKRFRKMVKRYVQTLDTMAFLTRGMGAQYISVLQPYLFSRKTITEREQGLAKMYRYRRYFMINAFQRLDENLSRHHFPKDVYYVSALEAFNNSCKECFRDEVHLNYDGYRILLDYIIKEAQKKGFCPS